MIIHAIPPDSHLSHIKHLGIDFQYNLLIDRIVIKGVINILTYIVIKGVIDIPNYIVIKGVVNIHNLSVQL